MSLHALSIAILLCNPGRGQADSYATLLHRESIRHGFDAMTATALICHESRWSSGAASRDGEDYGLGQIRARYIGGCKGDLDPVRNPSDACLRTKGMLLDGESNLRLTADTIMRWKRLCRTKAGSASEKHWLAGYGGLSRPSQGTWCGRRRIRGRWVDLDHRVVQEVLSLKRQLSRGRLRRTSR
jgi:hypothetical protein